MTPPLPWDDLLAASQCTVYVAALDGTPTWVGGEGAWLGAAPGKAPCVFDLDREALEASRGDARLDLAYRVVDPEGGLRWVADRAERRELDGATRWVGRWLDATAERVAQRTGLALARLEAWSQLGSAVAHEVNNPLAGVLNYAELGRRLPRPDARYVESLDAISSEAQRIRTLTDGLQALPSRSSSTYPIEAPHLLRGLVAPLRRTLRERLVTLEVEAPPGLLPGRGVGLALQGALWELLDNAADACLSAAAPRLQLAAEVQEAGDDLRLVFSIRDNGPGIHDVERARGLLFSTRPGAAGLGLNLAGRWVDELGGRLRLGPGPDGGTLAQVEVPVH